MSKYNREWYNKNRERILAGRREYYKKHGRAEYQKNRGKILALKRRLYMRPADRAAAKEKNRIAGQIMKAKMIAAYGGQCSCCGENHPDFLTTDHYGQDRGATKICRGYSIKVRGLAEWRRLKKLGWPKDGIRLLCMNCNWATRWGHICPHVAEQSRFISPEGKEYHG